MSSNEESFNTDASYYNSELKLSYSRISNKSFIGTPREKKHYNDNPKVSFDVLSITGCSSESKKICREKCCIAGWRRAIAEDKPSIKKLQTLTGNIANSLYRKRNIDELIEKSFFNVVQLDSRGDLVSFTAYEPFPNVPSVPSDIWNDWLNANYRLKDANSRNALFVHYMVWQPKQAKHFLRILLEITFTEFLYLEQVIVVKPPRIDVPEFYKEYLTPVLPCDLENSSFDSNQILLVCLRKSIIRPLFIRTAFEDDLDIIMSVINNHWNEINDHDETYSFDIVSFIYQEEKKILIYEFEGNVSGIMILNLKIDFDILNKGFELAPFFDLEESSKEITQNDRFYIPEQTQIRIKEGSNYLIANEFLLSPLSRELKLDDISSSNSYLQGNSESFLSKDDISEFSVVKFSSDFLYEASRFDKFPMDDGSSSDIPSGPSSSVGDFKMTFKNSIGTLSYIPSPKYKGDINAFMIDFFAVDCNIVDEKLSSYDFLEAAFKIVPDSEYCVLLIPTNILTYPLLDLFVRVTPRPLSGFKRELYLCHKKSLLITSMTVRLMEKENLIAINEFLKSFDRNKEIYQDILKSCFIEQNTVQGFLLFVGEEIVGLSVIDCEDYEGHFHVDFEIEDFTAKTQIQPVVKHLILNPIYQTHTQFFLRNVMRLTDLTCLYFIKREKMKNEGVFTALRDFVPVKPKKKAGLSEKFLSSKLNGEKVESPFNLYLFNTKICEIPKLYTNIVIVVVGASRTAMSFLETLIFGQSAPYTSFNNLICVTPYETGIDDTDQDLQNLMFPIRDNYSLRYKSMLSLKSYVTFIYGVMTKINRSAKYILVNNSATVKYDYLILTCGEQYLSPSLKCKESVDKGCRKYFKSPLSRFLPSAKPINVQVPKPPSNMFLVNSRFDAKVAIRSLRVFLQKIKNFMETDKKFVVYGHDLHVFLAINTLLKLGIPGEAIVFVEPFPSETKSVTLFNDHKVDQAVLQSIKDFNIEYHTKHFLYDWSLSSENYITSLVFHSKHKRIVIPCLAFFPYTEKKVSSVTFNACVNAGLVYDRRLVINRNFRTNDSHIYAAGPLTKYSRRYYAENEEHRFFNSTEVGQKLADVLRRTINLSTEDQIDNNSLLVPQMKAPVKLFCQLPGDFNLFIVRKPGKFLDFETSYNFFDYGEVLTTGDCEMTRGLGYFRLHIDSHGFVESILCYTKEKIDYVNLSSLYGLHEKLLNNLLCRYDLALIPDLFAYFREPWALALFHGNYPVLRSCNYEAFEQELTKDGDQNFIDKVLEDLAHGNWRNLSEKLRTNLENEYKNSPTEDKIINNLLKFIEYYKEELPVYATPSLFKSLISKSENSNFL